MRVVERVRVCTYTSTAGLAFGEGNATASVFDLFIFGLGKDRNRLFNPPIGRKLIDDLQQLLKFNGFGQHNSVRDVVYKLDSLVV